jgi:hypothetical protein
LPVQFVTVFLWRRFGINGMFRPKSTLRTHMVRIHSSVNWCLWTWSRRMR